MLGTDSLNDVSCAGKDTYIVEKISGRECEVKGFHDSWDFLSNIEHVNLLYKYFDETGCEYLLELNQALNFTKSITNSILCTNQA